MTTNVTLPWAAPKVIKPAWTASTNPRYQAYTLDNYRNIPQTSRLSPEQHHAIRVVGSVLPFKVNNYVVEELINWDDPRDPMFVLNFPQRDMLLPHHFEAMERALATNDRETIERAANGIRLQLNPHPAGQRKLNIPRLRDGTGLPGMQHKYAQTVLFFPSQGQTCHAYCSFCFRWPQFVGMQDLKFAMKEAHCLVRYLEEHPEVTDVLFTGGDPMVMRASILRGYVEALLQADLPNLQNIRIGSKSLSYWPYKFLTDPDAEETLELFRRVTREGKHLAFMAHFNHPAELRTPAVQAAIRRVLRTGAVIRTQSPILRHINASSEIWAALWREQVALGLFPYYMFATRDTGAQHFFAVPLVEASRICQAALSQLSGIGRTVRGLSMSATPGKIQVAGPVEIKGERVLILRMIQARKPEWIDRLFFAQCNEKAIWIDDLVPAFGEAKFFFQEDSSQLPHRPSPTLSVEGSHRSDEPGAMAFAS